MNDIEPSIKREENVKRFRRFLHGGFRSGGMIRVAIVEDEVESLNELKVCFDRYQVEKNCSIEIDSFDTADKFLSDYTPGVYSIVFMDIEMPGINGMDAARMLREKDGDILLFFVTNLAQYALESYEVQAFMFMVKPVVYDNFLIKMERAIRRIGDADVRRRHAGATDE